MAALPGRIGITLLILPVWYPNQCDQLDQDIGFTRFDHNSIKDFGIGVGFFLQRRRLGVKFSLQVFNLLLDGFKGISSPGDIFAFVHSPTNAAKGAGCLANGACFQPPMTLVDLLVASKSLGGVPIPGID